MHYLDELLTLHSRRDPATQKYALTTAANIPIGADTEPLVEFLAAQAASPHAGVRHQARFELGKLLPGFLRHAYALDAAATGLWSQICGRDEMESHSRDLALALSGAGLQEDAALAQAGLAVLAPVADTIAQQGLSGSPRVKLMGSLLLGRIHGASTLDRLADRIRSGAAGFGDAAALAEHPSEGARELLLSTVNRWGAGKPDLIMLLAGRDDARATALLQRLEARTGDEGRCNVALAASWCTDPAAKQILARLIGRREGWVNVYALDALARAPQPPDVALVREAYHQADHEFVRVRAVHAAGHIASSDAIAFLLDRLVDGAPRVQAAALEALARQRFEPARLAQAAAGLLSSPLLKARVIAILLLARTEPDRAARPLKGLCLSDDAVERLEGAFILGYLGGPTPARALLEMARKDPSLPVRVEAVRSLVKQPWEVAAEKLLEIMSGPAIELAAIAARALAGAGEDVLPQVEDRLARTLAGKVPAVIRKSILRTIGTLGARSTWEAGVAILNAHLAGDDPEILLGALGGLKCVGGAGENQTVRQLCGHGDSRVRSAAAQVAFLGGDLDAVSVLEALVRGPREEAILAGLSGLVEIAALLPHVVSVARFQQLRNALSSRDSQHRPSADRAPALAPSAGACPVISQGSTGGMPAGPPPLVRPCPEALDLGGAVEQLEAAYSGERPAMRARSARSTRPVQADAWVARINAVSELVGLLPAPETISRLRTYAPLLTAFVLLMLPVTLVAHRYGEVTRSRAGSSVREDLLARVQPAHLIVTRRSGTATRTGTGGGSEPLGRGDLVGPGDSVSAGADSEIQLSDKQGDTLWIGARGSVDLRVPDARAGPSPSTALAFAQPEGDVFFDFRRVSSMEISLGPARVIAHEAALRLGGSGAERVFTVTLGSATLLVAGRDPKDFSIGESMQVR